MKYNLRSFTGRVIAEVEIGTDTFFNEELLLMLPFDKRLVSPEPIYPLKKGFIKTENGILIKRESE